MKEELGIQELRDLGIEELRILMFKFYTEQERR